LSWSRSNTVAEGILAGSPALECEFVERFLPRLTAFFRARAIRPELVDELTQETIIAALLALRAGKLRDHDAMDSFVLGIARRQLAEAFRVQARHPAAPTGDEIEVAPAGRTLTPELTLTVRNEFDRLPYMDQLILWLILVEGCRPAEVATQVGLAEDAVRQRKSRLLRRLAEKLNASAVTNPDLVTTLQRRSIPGTAP
jgi:RNA polymerase sigma factor (sigma-70 family)